MNLLNMLVELGFAKHERAAKSMIDGGNVYLAGMFRKLDDTFVPYEHKVDKKQYDISDKILAAFTCIKVGDKYKLYRGLNNGT